MQPSISAECFDSSVIEPAGSISLFSFEYRPEFMVYNAATDSWESHLYVDDRFVKTCVDLLTYQIENNCYYITGFDWDNFNITDLIIPDYIEGVPVTRIESYAFCYAERLESVVLPDTLIYLGSGAFDSCYNLKKVTLGKGMTSIPDMCFSGCSALTTINLSRNITSISDYAFYYCNALAHFIVDPQNSFFTTDYYGNLVYKDSAELVCPALTDGIFKVSKLISSVNFSELRWQVDGFFVEPGHDYYATDDYGVVFNKDMTELICAPIGIAGDYVVPDGVTEIPNSAFSSCKITSITLPSSVASIGNSAFRSCDYLESATIKGYLSKMGEWCFAYCSKLVNFDCPGLANVTFENDIFCNIFRDCSKLPRTSYAGGTYIGSTTNPYFCLEKGSATELHPDTVLILNSSGLRGSASTELIIPAGVRYICNCGLMSIAATSVHIVSTDIGIDRWAFTSRNTSVTTILCAFGQDYIWASVAPWGATNATIHWNFKKAHSGGSDN